MADFVAFELVQNTLDQWAAGSDEGAFPEDDEKVDEITASKGDMRKVDGNRRTRN
jgi:hypothetical protein